MCERFDLAVTKKFAGDAAAYQTALAEGGCVFC